MNSVYEVFFRGGHGTPYTSEIYAFECDGETGMLEFNGYYYVNDDNETRFRDSLPKEETISVQKHLPVEPRIYSSEGPSAFKDSNGTNPIVSFEVTEYRVDAYIYKILVERREKLYNTNEISTIEDDDGSEMNVCFFPTDRQRIYFRVLETLRSEQNVPYKGRRQIGVIQIPSISVEST